MSNTHVVTLMGVLAAVLVGLFLMATMQAPTPASPTDEPTALKVYPPTPSNVTPKGTNEARQTVQLPEITVQHANVVQ